MINKKTNLKNTKVFLLCFIVISLSLLTLPSSTQAQTTYSYYYTNATHTVNSETGYTLQTSIGSATTSLVTNFTGSDTVELAYTAWLLHSNNETAELLTGDTPTAITDLGTNSTGLHSQTASFIGKNLVLNLNAIKVTIYMRFGGGEWLAKANFITDLLMEKQIIASTVTFTAYTNVTQTATETTATIYWGNSVYQSGLSGLVLKDPLAQEHALAEGLSGNIVGMIIYPFTYIIGELFYGLLILGVAGNLYLKHQKVTALLVIFLLFGGASGVGLLIPVEAYRTIYILTLLVIAAVLYKTFR